MAKRFVGREAIFRGKSLFELCCNLKNFGEGRVVYRHNLRRFPEPSYYRLTTVEPDMSDTERLGGQAWGEKVYRGLQEGVSQIDAGYKTDWWLVPKEAEEEFCKITAVMDKKPQPPSHIPCPPLLELMVRSESVEADRKTQEDPLMLPLLIDKARRRKSAKNKDGS
ncbi:hypothetical protein BaRGS_00035357 [Batillaria attramentaria]|uniref:28S ribosomal protein S34, mitochondrial n=1 Tax=Batillaria attramentaria TaxID=370345 RepID=A0ABD0JF31_9CAEN